MWNAVPVVIKLITKDEGQGQNVRGQRRISKQSGAKVDSKIARFPSTRINAEFSKQSSTKMDSKVSEHSSSHQEASTGVHAHPGGDHGRLQH